MKHFYTAYLAHCAQRAQLGLPPLPLNREQTGEVIRSLTDNDSGEYGEAYLSLLLERVRPGLDPSAELKASYLYEVSVEAKSHALLTPELAVSALGSMKSGFGVHRLVALLPHSKMGEHAARALSKMVHFYEEYDQVCAFANEGLPSAHLLLQEWATESWLLSREAVPSIIEATAFYAKGVTTTDDLSPAGDVATRSDIPLHALSMLKFGTGAVEPDIRGERGPVQLIRSLQRRHSTVAFCGDIVGVGSSRASATNSLMWHFGFDIGGQPNKRRGAVTIAAQFAPIFLTAQRDYGALPLIADIRGVAVGSDLTIDLEAQTLTIDHGKTRRLHLTAKESLNEVRAGGRLDYRLGRRLTGRARAFLEPSSAYISIPATRSVGPFTLAQKIVGRAVGRAGVAPGEYCEPKISTIALPDDAGPVAAEELNDLGCSGFRNGLVVQSFCHTAAYPTPRDIEMQRTQAPFITHHGGLALRPGDGVIHTWVNKFLVPDQVGTGADSHTRFPVGISFPAASNLVAFAAATGVMPLTMPESVLVRFSGRLKSHLTVRDIVNFIPFSAAQKGWLDTSEKEKKNVFSGRIIEIQGLEWLSVEEAFELCDSTAERSAVAVAIQLDITTVQRHLASGVHILRDLLGSNYESRAAILARIREIEAWQENPVLVKSDLDAVYAAEIHIDLDDLNEPMLCMPNDPDHVKPLSQVQPVGVTDVFLGSCMTTRASFRDARDSLKGSKQFPVQFWVAPPSRLLEDDLTRDGTLSDLGHKGARLEIPGCSLCMGNQARVPDGATVVSTSTRNYPNRMGNGANVYLSSARVAALAAKYGRIPTLEEYLQQFLASAA